MTTTHELFLEAETFNDPQIKKANARRNRRWSQDTPHIERVADRSAKEQSDTAHAAILGYN